MTTTSWPKIAVVGAGAVGGYFGGMLARAGAPVVLIGRPAFAEAVNREGLLLDTTTFREHIRAQASAELSAARGAELVLFCVKTTDTASTARELAGIVAPGAVIVSLQNGVDNAEQIAAASGLHALPAAVYVAASVPAPGTVKHGGRGDLVLGPPSDTTRRIASLFEQAGVPVRISENIAGELWTKFTGNCGMNAVSALGQITYGNIAASAEARQLVERLTYEVLAVASAAGIVLPAFADPQAAFAMSMKIAAQLTNTYSSTAQDMARRKKTEIDSLNGYIVRKGRELGIPTPINETVFTLVKLAEASF